MIETIFLVSQSQRRNNEKILQLFNNVCSTSDRITCMYSIYLYKINNKRRMNKIIDIFVFSISLIQLSVELKQNTF